MRFLHNYSSQSTLSRLFVFLVILMTSVNLWVSFRSSLPDPRENLSKQHLTKMMIRPSRSERIIRSKAKNDEETVPSRLQQRVETTTKTIPLRLQKEKAQPQHLEDQDEDTQQIHSGSVRDINKRGLKEKELKVLLQKAEEEAPVVVSSNHTTEQRTNPSSLPHHDNDKREGPSHPSLAPPLFSICLLTKDDVDILPEWIAYHYYAMDLRHLVVAVDPTSQHDPHDVLETFRQHLPLLQIDQWSDNDFLPDWFTVDKNYGNVPNFMGVELHDNQTFQEWYTLKKVGYNKRMDMTIVNNHRFRQTTFIAKCSQHLYKTYSGGSGDGGGGDLAIPGTNNRRVLVSTLDSDEYLVVNPWIINNNQISQQRKQKDQILAAKWRPGSLLKFLLDSGNATQNACIQVPRLMFGSVEDHQDQVSALVKNNNNNDNTATLLSTANRTLSTFETLRWKYHAAYNDTRNFQQKVILDMTTIFNSDTTQQDELWGDMVNSVHRPSRTFCPPETDQGAFNETALVANHYIGSWERYNSRKDLRRNRKRYRDRSNLTYAKESGWIDGWLEGFVHEIGIETASTLLRDYIVDGV